jgi:hypothetical protein
MSISLILLIVLVLLLVGAAQRGATARDGVTGQAVDWGCAADPDHLMVMEDSDRARATAPIAVRSGRVTGIALSGDWDDRLLVVVLIAALAGYALHALAQGRAEIRTAVTTVGTSSSNGISFAWFYDAADRTVYMCRSGGASADIMDCKAKTTLP